MVSVRITAAGAVVFATLSFLTAPVSACDERFIKKCEKASAAAAAAGEQSATPSPTAKRKAAGQVQVVVSRRSKHTRFVKRARAPGFTVKRERGMRLTSAEVRATTLPTESALTRRFRGFINPQPIAENAFETWRTPHIVAVNLEPPVSVAPNEALSAVPEAPVSAPAATMELASAESRPVTLPELPPAKPAMLTTANAAAAPPMAAQMVVSASPPAANEESPVSRFPIHQLVLALCGALGAASALRFIVGA